MRCPQARRVVVTGLGGVTALGSDWPTIRAALAAGRTGVVRMPDWDRFASVNTRLGAPVPDFSVEERYPRKALRSMGRVARFAVFSAERALDSAGLLDTPDLRTGRVGAAFGSSFGSPDAVLGFFELKREGASAHLNATSYIRMMSHTALVNVGVHFGLTGRLIPANAACASASQAIGFAAEAILLDRADVMVAGGAEELDITDSAVFDTLFATSTRHDDPAHASRPYDASRDGLVIGEGGAALVLEERAHALARGATIYGELAGFATNSDGTHVTQPNAATMEQALRLALADAGIDAGAVGIVNGHGTATEGGDIAETQATRAAFGRAVPIHSLKGHFGHSLGACGAIEAWLGLEMLRESLFWPTANLHTPDPRCGDLDYLMDAPRRIETEYLMTNNFAFGGVNTSLIFRRV